MTVTAPCAAIGASLEQPPTSEALIAQALADGDITFEESLLYRALALYDHPNLPGEFRSPVMNYHAALELFTDILENESTLSPQLLADLAPYTARPADPISIFNNPPVRPGQASVASPPAPWVSLPAAGGKARVWVKQGPDSDNELADYALETTRVWFALPGIFRYGIPDTPNQNDTPAGNPDSAIDLYFPYVGDVDPRDTSCNRPAPNPQACRVGAGGGYTGYTSPRVGNTSASYVMIDANVLGPMLTSHIAHELMHVGQHAYDVTEPFWLKDATASWGAVRVLQKLSPPVSREPNFEYLPKFFEGLDKKLTRDTEDDLNRYGSWLYIFAASMDQGDQIVTKFWEKAAAPGIQNEEAIDSVFKFDDHFDEFATRNWNEKPPLTVAYGDADSTFPPARKPDVKQVFLGSPEDAEIKDSLVPLSARYYRYTFGAPVKGVFFHNKLDGKPHAHLWGIAKISGEWQAPEDWTGIEEKSWCMDDPSQHLDELILIFSNSDMSGADVTSSGSSVEAKATGVCADWQGTVTYEYHYSGDFGERDSATVGTISFIEQDDPSTHDRVEYVASGGQLTHSYDDHGGEQFCHTEGTVGPIDTSNLTLYPETGHYLGHVYTELVPDPDCLGGGTSGEASIGHFEVGRFTISDDGRTLVGDYNESYDDEFGHNTYHFAWHLTAVTPPPTP